MSWAGKKSVKSIFGSLFHKEQAPSASSGKEALTAQQRSHIEKRLLLWQEDKAYRIADRTVAEASARIGTSSVLLHRYFAEKGTDFRTWRSHLRIQDAMKELIAFPEDSASVIGRRVGIPDRSNFNRQFKAVTGEFPESWRKKQK